MDPYIAGSFIDSISNLLGGLASYDVQKKASDQNYQSQVDTLNWQKEAQQTTWNREDNAVQRRVADLKAAGLSPVLAAGSAASTSSPTTVITPQRDTGYAASISQGLVNAGHALGVGLSKKRQAELQSEALQLQQAGLDFQKFKYVLDADLLREELKTKQIQNDILDHDREIYLKSRFTSKGGLWNYGSQLLGITEEEADAYRAAWKKRLEENMAEQEARYQERKKKRAESAKKIKEDIQHRNETPSPTLLEAFEKIFRRNKK